VESLYVKIVQQCKANNNQNKHNFPRAAGLLGRHHGLGMANSYIVCVAGRL